MTVLSAGQSQDGLFAGVFNCADPGKHEAMSDGLWDSLWLALALILAIVITQRSRDRERRRRERQQGFEVIVRDTPSSAPNQSDNPTA